MHLREWRHGGGQLERDLDRLFALDQTCFAPGVAYTRAELAAFLTHPSAFSVLIEEAADPTTTLLGFAIARTLRSQGKSVFHIISIDVAPAARRRRIGTMLMEWMAAKAVALRMQALRLEVAVDNADALEFYEQLGFTEVGRIAGYYLNSIDALVLERELSAGR